MIYTMDQFHYKKNIDDKNKNKNEHENGTDGIKRKHTNCCCHDYPGHFSSVNCNNSQINKCKYILGYDRSAYHSIKKKPYNSNTINSFNSYNNTEHREINHREINHTKKSCNCGG